VLYMWPPGHISRNCFANGQIILGAPSANNNVTNRGSRNPRGDANVYIKIKLFKKKVNCLIKMISVVLHV